jgi:hypothetical protein
MLETRVPKGILISMFLNKIFIKYLKQEPKKPPNPTNKISIKLPLLNIL